MEKEEGRKKPINKRSAKRKQKDTSITVPKAWERDPIFVVDPEPINRVIPVTPSTTVESVKSATPEIIILDDQGLPIEIMTDLIFEDIGGQELIDISRNDIVNGETISYQIIKNLSFIQQEYSPNKILSLQQTADKYFNNFPIKLNLRAESTIIYRNPTTGGIIIELNDIAEDEEVEVQIATNGIIEEVDLI